MIESLEHLIDRPDGTPRSAPAGDLLSHVLAQIRLTGDRVFARTLAARERLDLDAGDAHIVVVKTGALQLTGEAQKRVVGAGELLLLPVGPGALRLAASRSPTEVVVCRFWFDPESLRGMVFALPHCVHIQRETAAGWIDGLVHFAMIETDDVQPGAALMISRIIDLMVIRALRSWVHQGNASGWLGGLSDARIARALKTIHERPMQRWSVDALADQVGMSRSSFCACFTAHVGRAPLRYQNEWRLGLARDMLARREARVGEIGLRIGYAPEAAFSRAFRQMFGHAPRDEYALTEPAPRADGPGSFR